MWSNLVNNFKGDLTEFVSTVTSDASKAIHSATENFLPTDADDEEEDTSPPSPPPQFTSLLPPSFVLENEENFTGEILGGQPEAIADYEAFTQARQSEGPQVIAEQQASFADVIEADVTLSELHAKLVPEVVSAEEFASRYFYLRNKLRLQQLRQEPNTSTIEASAEEQVGWGDDDDEEAGWGSSEEEQHPNNGSKEDEANEYIEPDAIANNTATTPIDASVDVNVNIEQIKVLKKELALVKKESQEAKDQANEDAITADLNFQTLKVSFSDVKQKLEDSEARNVILEKENEILRSELAAATVASAMSAAAAANASANVALLQSASEEEEEVEEEEEQDTSVTNPFIAVTVPDASKLDVTDARVDGVIGNVDSAYMDGGIGHSSTGVTNVDIGDVDSVDARSGGAKTEDATTDWCIGGVSTTEYSAGAKDTGEVAVQRSNAQPLSDVQDVNSNFGAAKNGLKDGLTMSSDDDDDGVDVDVDEYMKSRLVDDDDDGEGQEDVDDVDVDGEEVDGWDAWE